MRSTYNGSNQNSSSGEDYNWFEDRTINNSSSNVSFVEKPNKEVDVEKVLLHDNLVRTFMDMERSVSVMKQEELSKQEEIASNGNYNEFVPYNGEKVTNDIPDVPKKKGLSKGAIVGIVLGSIALVAIIVVSILFAMGTIKINGNSETTSISSESAIADIQKRVDVLYTDNLKSDIKDGYTVSDLDAFRAELKELPNNVDHTSLDKELKTIELYMVDKKKIDVYSDLSYNIEPDYVGTDCNSVIGNAENYTVAGLKATICNKASSVIVDRDEYLSIKKELSTI